MRLIDADELKRTIKMSDLRRWEKVALYIALISAPTIEAEPVRCDMCKKMETGHGRIRLYSGNGWQAAIGRRIKDYELVISHHGDHLAIPIEFCPYCGASLKGGEEK